MNHSFFVGIDVAKHHHDAFILNNDTGEVLYDQFHFDNNFLRFSSLLEILSGIPKDAILFGVESTGRYHLLLARFLHSHGYKVGILNPLQTNRLHEVELRQTKTDKIDARIITQALIHNYHKPYCEECYEDIKLLSRMRMSWVHERSKLKVDIVNCLDVLFPEFASFVGIYSKLAYSILKKYSSAFQISNARIDGLSNTFTSFSKGRTPDKLKQLAKQSIGSHSSSLVFQLHITINRIESITSDIIEVESLMKEHLDALHSPITSIPGISTVLASTILGDIGDVSRFSTARQLIAFSGLYPRVYQSGQYNALNLSLSKRGSSVLRYALIQAASLIWRFDPTFRTYYERKRDVGKHYRVALCHIAKKLTHVIFTLLKTNTLFIKGY